MREIEKCTVEETAAQLVINQGTLADTMSEAFPFMGRRCARLTEAVMARLEVESLQVRRGNPDSGRLAQSSRFACQQFDRGPVAAGEQVGRRQP